MLGEVEPLIFLHAWACLPWPTEDGKPTHQGENPSDEQVRAYAEAHLADMEDFMKDKFAR